jgi:hypothetical protein
MAENTDKFSEDKSMISSVPRELEKELLDQRIAETTRVDDINPTQKKEYDLMLKTLKQMTPFELEERRNVVLIEIRNLQKNLHANPHPEIKETLRKRKKELDIINNLKLSPGDCRAIQIPEGIKRRMQLLEETKQLIGKRAATSWIQILLRRDIRSKISRNLKEIEDIENEFYK